MNDFETRIIDTGGETTTLEDMYETFKDFKSRFNSFMLSLETNETGEEKLDDQQHQEILAIIDRIELKFQLHQRLLDNIMKMMDLGDEIFAVLDNFKALRIDAQGAEARVEDMYKEFTDLKLRSNSSLTKLMQEYQIPSHELYQGVFDRMDRLESMLQLLFNDLFPKK
jgi:excinuclease UvrABC ATPase subunit